MAARAPTSASASTPAAGGAGDLIAAAVSQRLPLEEEDVDLLRNFGDHALMQRVQVALERQLRERLLRVDAELREQEEARDGAKRAREAVGVELYGVQQQLARLQMQLEATNRNVEALHDIRVKAELELKVFTDGFATRQAAIEAEEAKLNKFKGELDGVNDTLRQVERYNEEVNAEVALTKRTAAKAEVELGGKEVAKVKQDLYIDSLTAQIKRQGEALALYQAQVAAQRAETSSASESLADAGREMDEIRAEKKELMSQWNSALVAMKKRDEAYNTMQESIRQQQEVLNTMDAEEGNLRKAIVVAQEAHAKLQDQLAREEAVLASMAGSADGLKRQFSALEERHSALAGTLESTEGHLSRVVVELSKLEKLVRETDRDRMLVDRQRYGIEDEIAELMSTRVTNEKAARALLKDARKLIERVHEVELACADMENQIAAAKVEALGVNTRILGLRDTLAAAEGEVKAKEGLIGRYELEIRQRNDAIDKKMTIVDRLNRKHEKMVAEMPEVENMGPLHAEVHNLQKAIGVKREAVEALQKRWLSDQTALVAAANDAEVKSTKLREMQSQVVLLNQKRIRMDSGIASQLEEAKRLEVAMKGMHEDMARINALIARNASLSARLAAATTASATAFSEELRAAERELATAEARVLTVREEKGRLLDELMECERQIVLWEKKITLEKETQEALDPTVGESEIASMEKDIHRMQLRYEAVKREQERLVAEMERAIEKREVIAMKNRSAVSVTLASATAVGKGTLASTASKPLAATTNSKTGGEGATRVGLKQRAVVLRRDLETKLAQAGELEGVLAAHQAQLTTLLTTLSQRTGEISALEARAAAIQRGINAALFAKQKGIESVAALTRLLHRLQALEAGKLPPLTAAEVAKVSDKLAEAEASRAAVRELVASLSTQHTDLSEVLQRVAQLIDIAPTLDV